VSWIWTWMWIRLYRAAVLFFKLDSGKCRASLAAKPNLGDLLPWITVCCFQARSYQFIDMERSLEDGPFIIIIVICIKILYISIFFSVFHF